MKEFIQSKAQIVIFASGHGSNFRALLAQFGPSNPMASVSLLITDRPTCGASLFATENAVPVVAAPLTSQMTTNRTLHEEQMLKAIQNHILKGTKSQNGDTFIPKTIIVLAGYMRIMSKTFLCKLNNIWQNPDIVNLHPAHLDQYKGPKGYARAVAGLFPHWGITVHRVTAQVDQGEIIGTQQILVYPHESAFELQMRNQLLEHDLLIQCIQGLISGSPKSHALTDSPRTSNHSTIQ